MKYLSFLLLLALGGCCKEQTLAGKCFSTDEGVLSQVNEVKVFPDNMVDVDYSFTDLRTSENGNKLREVSDFKQLYNKEVRCDTFYQQYNNIKMKSEIKDLADRMTEMEKLMADTIHTLHHVKEPHGHQ